MDFVELFAGIGLFRRGLEAVGPGWNCLCANDFDANKATIYRAQFGAGDLVEGDVAQLTAEQIPGHPELITGSFPCQDLSLAGNRAGLAGGRSGNAQHFFRLVEELQADGRAPRLLVLENVVGLLTSHDGEDIRTLFSELNRLGYGVDVMLIDAAHWLPQSRPRIFIVATLGHGQPMEFGQTAPTHPTRSAQHVRKVVSANADLRWHFLDLPPLPAAWRVALADIVDQEAQLWWAGEIYEREMGYIANGPASLARLNNALRLVTLTGVTQYLTGYRRMRRDEVNLELRHDGVAGCLRTANGGSSKQILVKVDGRGVHMRFMTPAEYARLMGVDPAEWVWADLPASRHLTGFGDAVAVPVITWLGQALAGQALAGQGIQPQQGLLVAW